MRNDVWPLQSIELSYDQGPTVWDLVVVHGFESVRYVSPSYLHVSSIMEHEHVV